jgi:hypothetical protein
MSEVISSLMSRHDCDELYVTATKYHPHKPVGFQRNAKGFARTLIRLGLKRRPTRDTDDMIYNFHFRNIRKTTELYFMGVSSI